MTVYSDDINRGFEILLEHLKTIGLYYRILNIKPIDPLLKHPIFGDSHCGGVKFDFYLANIDSKWEIVYTRRDLFDLIGSVDGKRQIFFDISYDDLINILFSLNEQKKKEEDDLLGEAISETQYRKIAKKMHYIERDEDT